MMPDEPRAFALEDLVSCMKREIGLRQTMYGRLRDIGKVTAPYAESQMVMMEVILGLLEDMVGKPDREVLMLALGSLAQRNGGVVEIPLSDSLGDCGFMCKLRGQDNTLEIRLTYPVQGSETKQ